MEDISLRVCEVTTIMNKIIFDQKILSGKPIIKGTRISVEFILELLSSGMDAHEIVKEYPHLTKNDVMEAVTYAAKALKNEDIIFSGKPAKADKHEILN